MEEATGRLDSPFDLDATLQRMGGDLRLFVKIVEFFMEDSGPLVTQIELGMQQANAKTVEQASHSLKGLLANFSAEGGVRAAARLEEAGRTAQFAETPAMLDDLKAELARLRRELQAYLPSQS